MIGYDFIEYYIESSNSTVIKGVPLKGVNNIKFGMSRDKVNTLLQNKGTFKKGPDDFGWCHVYYESDNKCKAIEVFNDVTLKVGSKTLMPGDIINAMTIFKDLVNEDGESYISHSKSVGITVSGNKIKGVLFGKRGYYK